MIEVVPALTHHADLINPKKLYGAVASEREATRQAIKNLPAVSILANGEILAIVGYQELYTGSGEIWALIAEEAKKYPVAFGRKAKETLETFARTHKLRRLQIVVRRGYEEAFDFAIFLGFEPEGILRKYGPEGDDYVMMGKVY
jgi:hypothetical protein